MKKIKLSLLMFVAVFFATNIDAQNQRTADWCHTDENAVTLEAQNPMIIQQREAVEEYIREYTLQHKDDAQNTEAVNFIIPVVFHVLTNNGVGFVSKQDIDNVMLTLNEDFQRLNNDAANTRNQFIPFAADSKVEFRLAHKDPQGNCTEGIVRVETPLSVDAGDAVKNVSRWDTRKYLNIWTVANIGGSVAGPGIIAGYAQFPWNGIDATYGVVIDSRFVNRSGRTLTHEVGHCFGLLHVFQNGCSSSGSGGGDLITDTPPSNTNGFTCGSASNPINTCSQIPTGDPYGINEVDQTENFMSYASCQNMLSAAQKVRMDGFLSSTSTSTGLKQLSNAGNLTFTGTSDPYNAVTCTPIADFTFDKEFICEGASVTFTDDSYNAIPTAWNWTFTGGSPSSSTSSNPTITYNNPGVYSVTHEPGTTVGSGLKTKSNIITVSSLTADFSGSIIDGFENSSQFSTDWIVINNGGQTWANNSSAASTGTRSARIRNFFTSTSGEKDVLISSSFDISTITNKQMTFKHAFAKKTSSNTDRLLVYYSTDCGASWILKLPLTASNLATAANQSSVFVPGANDWTQRTIDLSAIGSATNVRFKFEFQSGGGNDIYIDDINIGNASVGIDDFSNVASFNVYPNPTNSSAQISFNLIKSVESLSIKVRNAVGQEVTNVVNGQSFSSGTYTLKIDEQRKLASGIYFIEFNADNNIKIQKLIVQ